MFSQHRIKDRILPGKSSEQINVLKLVSSFKSTCPGESPSAGFAWAETRIFYGMRGTFGWLGLQVFLTPQ